MQPSCQCISTICWWLNPPFSHIQHLCPQLSTHLPIALLESPAPSGWALHPTPWYFKPMGHDGPWSRLGVLHGIGNLEIEWYRNYISADPSLRGSAPRSLVSKFLGLAADTLPSLSVRNAGGIWRQSLFFFMGSVGFPRRRFGLFSWVSGLQVCNAGSYFFSSLWVP